MVLVCEREVLIHVSERVERESKALKKTVQSIVGDYKDYRGGINLESERTKQ